MSYIKNFWSYCWGTVFKPASTFKQIAADGSLSYSVAAMFLCGLLYSLLALVLYLHGHQPSLPILINVPSEKFYLAEAIYLIPFTLQLWVLFSGLCHLFAKIQDGKGSFDATLAVLGFSNAIPNIIMFWFPDFIVYLLFSKILDIPVVIYGTAWFVWLIYLSAVGLKATQQISLLRALVTVLISFLIQFIIGVFFIR